MAENVMQSIEEEAVDQIIAAYVEAREMGQNPDPDEWLRRFPEAASELSAFFDDQAIFQRRAAPLRDCLSGCEAVKPLSTELPGPGARLGDYELLEEIAQGGMGVVFKARQTHLNRLVALKMIRTGPLASANELRRFCLEAEAAARFDHPNIVPIYAIDSWNRQPYFSMRLIEGGNLASYLPRLQRNPGLAARTLAQIARAVHYAHQRGVLHRDLKPANILMDQDGQPHVTDFGLAKWVDEVRQAAGQRSGLQATQPVPIADQTSAPVTETPYQAHPDTSPGERLTQTGMAVGTPCYMAPEQADARQPNQAVTTAADVYSLGAMLYEMLTGRPPFREDTVPATLHAVMTTPPTPLRRIRPGISADLEAICLKCLAKDPAQRYASAAGLADDLERFGRNEPVSARQSGKLERGWRWCRRQPALAAAIALALLGLCSVTVLSTLFGLHEAEGRRAVDQALTKEKEALQEAETQRLRAEQNFRRAHQAIDDFYVRFREQGLSKAPGLQSFEKEWLEKALGYFKEFLQQKADDPNLRFDLARTNSRAGDITHYLGGKSEALVYFDRAIDMLSQLSQDDPAKRSLYDSWLAKTYGNRGVAQRALGQDQAAADSYRQAVKIYERLSATMPDDAQLHRNWALLTMNLSAYLRRLGRLEDALAASVEAERILGNLNDHLQNRLASAPAREQESLRREIEMTEGDLARAHLRRGEYYEAAGQRDKAEQAYDQARTIQERQIKKNPKRHELARELAENYCNLGNEWTQSGKAKEGFRLLHAAEKSLRELAEANPSAPSFEISLSVSLRYLGNAYRRSKDIEKALAYLSEARQRADAINAKLGGVAIYQTELASACNDLGVFHQQAKNPQKALECFQQAADLRRQLSTSSPSNLTLQRELATVLSRCSDVLIELKCTPDAVVLLRNALTQDEAILKAHPEVADVRRTYMDHVTALAKAQKRLNKVGDADRTWQSAITILQQLFQDHPQIEGLRVDLGRELVEYGMELRSRKQVEASLARHEQAVKLFDELEKTSGSAWGHRAHAYFQLGLSSGASKKPQEELRNYQTACAVQKRGLELVQKNGGSLAQPHSSMGIYLHNLGLAMFRNGDREAGEKTLREAITYQRQALDALPDHAGIRKTLNGHYLALADKLRDQNRFSEAAELAVTRSKLWPSQAVELYFVARDLARTADAVVQGKQSPSDEEKELRDRVADQALEVLTQAVASGFSDWKEINSTPGLAVVRARPGFDLLQSRAKNKVQ